ncbi:UbiA family prenyltransferase [Methanoregula sp.]|uniref:UbiA family prenyltransferase n=1 Tax=Methanoregula sp. TaxID=2052170 RepID=UPI0035628E36
MNRFNEATLKLLNSASLVGFSGGLRFFLAFILAGIAPNLLLVIAASLIIYATYTLDRSLDNKEDEVNHKEFMGASKATGLAASGIAILVGISLFFSKQLFSPPVFPFIIGILYSRGIPVGNRSIKLKAGFGIKNLVIGITWGGMIGLVILSTGLAIAALVIGIYFGMKLFINSTIFDLKDVEGDLAAGIRTLPVVLGDKKLKYLLISICIVQHMIIAMAMMSGILVHAGVFLAYSFIVSGTVILYYSPAFESDSSWLRRKFRILAINGEPIALVALSIVLPY